jgi:hypothetical protein
LIVVIFHCVYRSICFHASSQHRKHSAVVPERRHEWLAGAFPVTNKLQMRYLIHTSAIVIALVSNVGFAVRQTSPGGDHLSQTQQQAVRQRLGNEQTQSAPTGGQPQVGNKPPYSLQAAPMPENVATDVRQTKNLLFVKLPDRILLIDPDNKQVTEIIPVTETTGGGVPKQ